MLYSYYHAGKYSLTRYIISTDHWSRLFFLRPARSFASFMIDSVRIAGQDLPVSS